MVSFSKNGPSASWFEILPIPKFARRFWWRFSSLVFTGFSERDNIHVFITWYISLFSYFNNFASNFLPSLTPKLVSGNSYFPHPVWLLTSISSVAIAPPFLLYMKTNQDINSLNVGLIVMCISHVEVNFCIKETYEGGAN